MLINESVHNDDLGDVIGFFHGIPVRGWDAKATRVREETEVRVRIYARKQYEMQHAESAEAEAPFQYVVPDHEYINGMGIICPLTAQPQPAVA